MESFQMEWRHLECYNSCSSYGYRVYIGSGNTPNLENTSIKTNRRFQSCHLHSALSPLHTPSCPL